MAKINNDKSKYTFENNYYLSSMSDGAAVRGEKASGCANFPETALKACADMLGSPFVDNTRKDNFNNGYPIFEWQNISIKTGDINVDECVSIADAVLLQKYILNAEPLTENNWRLADLDEDGKVDVFDMIMMRKILATQKKIKVPNVVGILENKAVEQLKAAGLKVKVTYEINDVYAKGNVMAQSVDGNEEVPEGTTITITVSSGTGEILPTKVSLSRTSKTLNLAGNSDIKLQLTATVSPTDATDKKVTWSSSDAGVATVSADGLVTAVKNGKATITAKTNSGDVKAVCEINVVTEWTYSDYGAWSNWSTTPAEKTELRDVATKTEKEVESYNIEHFCTVSLNPEWHREYRNFSVDGNYSKYGLYPTYGEWTTQAAFGIPYFVKTPDELNSVQKVNPGEWSTGSQPGKNCADVAGYSFDGCIFYICGTNYKDVTYYHYRERTKTPTKFE